MAAVKQNMVTIQIPADVAQEVQQAAGRALGVATRAGELPARWQRALALLCDSLGGRIRVSQREWDEIRLWPDESHETRHR